MSYQRHKFLTSQILRVKNVACDHKASLGLTGSMVEIIRIKREYGRKCRGKQGAYRPSVRLLLGCPLTAPHFSSAGGSVLLPLHQQTPAQCCRSQLVCPAPGAAALHTGLGLLRLLPLLLVLMSVSPARPSTPRTRASQPSSCFSVPKKGSPWKKLEE